MRQHQIPSQATSASSIWTHFPSFARSASNLALHCRRWRDFGIFIEASARTHLSQFAADTDIETTNPCNLIRGDQQIVAYRQIGGGPLAAGVFRPPHGQPRHVTRVPALHLSIAIKERIPAPSKRTQPGLIITLHPEPHADRVQLEAGIVQPRQRADIGGRPAHRECHLVQQYVQETVQLTQPVADYLRPIAPPDRCPLRSPQARPQKRGGIAQGEMRSLDADGWGAGDDESLTRLPSIPSTTNGRGDAQSEARQGWPNLRQCCSVAPSPIQLYAGIR